MKYIQILLIILLFSCNSTRSTEPKSETSEIRISNIKYGPYERNMMDIYLPLNRNDKTPFVINIHGGAWTLGDKVWGASISEYLFNHNVAVVNMNYRFADDKETHLPQLLDDIDNVIKFIKQHSTKWNVRADGFVITGESAGAHMALCYAYKNPQNIKAVITRCAPTSFADKENLANAQKNNLIDAIDKMSGNREIVNINRKIPEAYKNVSPVNFVKNIPTLIFHGNQDELVPYTQALQLANALSQKKYIYQLITIPGASHNILLKENDRALIYSKSIEWIEKYGR